MATGHVHSQPIKAGIITGLIAGIIMAVVVMLVFWLFLGHSPLYPVQVIGATFLGEDALVGFNVSAVLVGLIVHLVPSAIWGLIFGIIAKSAGIKSAGKALVYGVGLGAVTMIDAYVLVPMFMQAMGQVDIWNREVPMMWDWAAHLVFGASFVLYPTVEHWLGACDKQHGSAS